MNVENEMMGQSGVQGRRIRQGLTGAKGMMAETTRLRGWERKNKN